MPCDDCSRADDCPPCVNESDHPEETMIEHFEKCVPGGVEALANARAEMEPPAVRRRRRPPGSASSSPDDFCGWCKHHSSWHSSGETHPCFATGCECILFVPVDAETAEERDSDGRLACGALDTEHCCPMGCQVKAASEPEDPNSGYRDRDECDGMYPPEPECTCGTPGTGNFEGPQADCPVHGLPEPEALVCLHDHWERDEQDIPQRCRDCGFEPESPGSPPRPPNAVAYATEGGAQFEIALSGDATVRAHDGALIITHASAVLAITQVRPMET